MSHHEALKIEQYAGHLLVRVVTVLRERTREALKPLGIDTAHFGILEVLSEKGPISQRTLGRLLQTDRTTIVRQVDELEKHGLLYRKIGQDRRINEVLLTKDGAKILENAEQKVRDVQTEILSPFSSEERDLFLSLLRRLYQNLQT